MRKNFYTGSIHFKQFQATLVFVAEKPPPPRMRKKRFTLDLSISCNFEQLWFLWQKSHPTPRLREIVLHWIYPFYAISSNFGFSGREATLVFVTEKPPPPGWGKMFVHWIYPFYAISSNFGFCGRKAPPPQDEGKFFTLDLFISGNFKELWFLWQKSPPSWDEGNIFLHWIYPFQAILSNFGFCGRKAPLPQDEGKCLYTGSIHLRQFWATLVFMA